VVEGVAIPKFTVGQGWSSSQGIRGKGPGVRLKHAAKAKPKKVGRRGTSD
jgi:hypothetical protein